MEVFNLRGSVIPLIDLRMKFGMNNIKQTNDTRFILMKDGEDIAGFVIDKLTMAISLNKSDISKAPETFQDDETIVEGIDKIIIRKRFLENPGFICLKIEPG